jgi:hypothetical protein
LRKGLLGIGMFARKAIHHLRAQRELRRQEAAFSKASEDVSGSRAFVGLDPFSLALSGISSGERGKPSLNAVLPELRADGIFAGLRTALEFSCRLADRSGHDLRIVILKNSLDQPAQVEMRQYLAAELGFRGSATFYSAEEMSDVNVHTRDFWIVTHWTTAHAVDVASRLGLIAKRRVMYLVQDYEPGFHAWGTEFALARSTYFAGFHHIVNSVPLQTYLAEEEGLQIADEFVFRPQIDLDRAQRAVKHRTAISVPTIFFYGRQSKPRNLFGIGISALRIVAEELERRGVAAEFVSAGERHGDIALGSNHYLRSLGKLSWDDYFETVANSNVALSLQHSPHPSHIPLDAIASGTFAVTNELRGTRAGLHGRMLVGEPEPAALASLVLEALARSALEGNAGFDPKFVETFGASLATVVDSVAVLMRERISQDSAEIQGHDVT